MDPAVAVHLSRHVIVVGAGLAGTLMSILLDRAGCAVTLIDSLKVYPNEFRAEQVVSAEELKRLGLLQAVVGDATPVMQAKAFRLFWRWGWLAKTAVSAHYGVRYDAMVNGARKHLPASVDFVNERVERLEVSPETQRVTLRHGRVIEGRLIVLATGLQSQLLCQLNLKRRMLSKQHSVAIGFDIKVQCHDRFRSSVLTVYGNNWLGGERQGSIDYVTFFLIGDSLRGNIFTHGKPDSEWTKRFKADPISTLLSTVPWIEEHTSKILAIDNLRVRPNDVMILENYLQPGVVCVGDTFLAPCPATGTGISRMLTEVGLLGQEYIPQWLATPGMDVEKVSTFYNDPRKKDRDAAALGDAVYHRGNTNGRGLRWFVRRVKSALAERRLLIHS